MSDWLAALLVIASAASAVAAWRAVAAAQGAWKVARDVARDVLPVILAAAETTRRAVATLAPCPWRFTVHDGAVGGSVVACDGSHRGHQGVHSGLTSDGARQSWREDTRGAFLVADGIPLYPVGRD